MSTMSFRRTPESSDLRAGQKPLDSGLRRNDGWNCATRWMVA